MKTGLLITTYNRQEYTLKCVESLVNSDMSKIDTIVVVDDASDDRNFVHYVAAMLPDAKGFGLGKKTNTGVAETMITGLDFLVNNECDILINLDNDMVVDSDWAERLLWLHQKHPETIATGFHTSTKDRHKIKDQRKGYAVKESVGGANIICNYYFYKRYLKYALLRNRGKTQNWDLWLSMVLRKINLNPVCLTPSAMEHIGEISSLGHSGFDKRAK